MRPWSKRAEELTQLQGPYADSAAWRSWFDGECFRLDAGSLFDAVDELDQAGQANLYRIFADLFDEAHPEAKVTNG